MPDSPTGPPLDVGLNAAPSRLGDEAEPEHGARWVDLTANEDDALMLRVARGDRHAFGQLVERHRDRIVGYLVRLTGSPDRAEDLAQETFVRLYHAATRYTPQGQLPAYLYRIATNLLRSEERRSRLVQWLSLDLASECPMGPDGEDPDSPPERALLNGELQRRLEAELAGLPLHLRVPLVLHEIEDWPLARIAEVMGTRHGTVKSRLSRGRKELRRRLAPYWSGGQR